MADDRRVVDAVEAEIVVRYGSDDRVVLAHGVSRRFDYVLQLLGRRKCSNGMEVRPRVHDQPEMDAKPGLDVVVFRGAGFGAVGSDVTAVTGADAWDVFEADAMAIDAIEADAIEAAVELPANAVSSMDGDVGALPFGYGTAAVAHHIVVAHIEAAAPGQSSQSHLSLSAVPPSRMDQNIDISIRCSVCVPSVP